MPLGATFDGIGTNIALFSAVADGVEVCFFGPDGDEVRVELPERSGSVWHGYLPDLDAGTRGITTDAAVEFLGRPMQTAFSPALLGRVRAAGFEVEDLALHRPGLGAVFLALTGRELRE